MIELIFGLMVAALAVAFGFGLAPPELAIQAMQETLSWISGAIALLLIVHALYRLFRDSRDSNTAWLRTLALMLVTLISVVALLYATTTKISAASVSGWPVGFLLSGQGALLTLALLFQLFRRKQNRIDDQHSIESDGAARSRGQQI